MKKEIIRKYEEWARIIDIAHELGKVSSTMATIVKKKKIKGFDVSKAVTLIASKKKCPEILNEVEKLLLDWINKKQFLGDCVCDIAICKKARALHEELHRQTPFTLGEEKCAFKVSAINSRKGLASTAL